ncbi:pyruvate carboxylase subunit B [Gloeobacter kilaueensis]|uniref:Pyruvate carboxylase subunit B n=1 Tax=Gloeobacter kilaueensis (strain ATCC BAA-2537 / CCAP 1431/1 / ULC 316 / JS1) TaxID=1183438 RepID=U5QIG2_GLOK1|nr:pyruvate carboxylase subunit B [Gloeobacter kilaueensis]AGY58678.1 pyruvate carboxylase subunit B [Gloeobacter kilaueensis JS1]
MSSLAVDSDSARDLRSAVPSRVGVTDTTFRDAHQSLLATRMTTAQMLPVAARMNRIGFHSMEVWGGATFDACIRFLGEDPWERLKVLRREMPDTQLQMLVRGQNLLGYRHYPDDIVERFIRRSVANGINIIRTFDALNDVRNLQRTIETGKECGAHVQGTLVYTVSPVHDLEHYTGVARELVGLGVDSLCIKDMAGLLKPDTAGRLIEALRPVVGTLPIQMHAHSLSGMASMAYWEAIQKGANIVDTAISPLALGSSQPATETMVVVLRDTPFDTGLDIDALIDVAEYFERIFRDAGNAPIRQTIIDTRVLSHQVPGGMITNLIAQLDEQRASHRLQEVLKELPKVRADLGYPPLVTPTSQIVGTQAVLNVLTGERYKIIPAEVRDYLLGRYGRPPYPIADSLYARVTADGHEPIAHRPADDLEPGWERAVEESAQWARCEEDALTYALFPQVAKKYFQARDGQPPAPAVKKFPIDLKSINDLVRAFAQASTLDSFACELGGTRIYLTR